MADTSTSQIYLDYNATTPVLAEVLEAMLPYLRGDFGNPSSGHSYGRRARRAVDQARRRVADLIGARPGEIVFTSGGTESNNLAIRGLLPQKEATGNIVTSQIEHPSVFSPCCYLEKLGWEVRRVGVGSGGCVRLEEVSEAVDDRTALVTIMHSNNETGVVQPIAEITEIAHRSGALMHSDASQSVGKTVVEVGLLGVDALSMAGHKFYAPKGVGALYLRSQVELTPLLYGASHERGRRAGTENVASIVAMGRASEIASQTLSSEVVSQCQLRDRLFDSLEESIPGVVINGGRSERLANTLNLRFPGVNGADLLAVATGVAASTGSACKSESMKPSPVLTGMGLSEEQALGSVRLSLGRETSLDEIEKAAEQLVAAWVELTGQ